MSRAPLRTWALGWAWLALLWAAGSQLHRLVPLQWLVALALLAALPAWGLWLGFMLRKRLQHAQFAEGGWVARWLSGGLWAACKAAALALLLCGAALWQAWFLAPWEWVLLALAAPLHALLAARWQRWLAPQFSLPAYAWRASQWAARLSTALLLGAAWLAGWAHAGLEGRDLLPATEPQVLDTALAAIAGAPSGLVRWGLDALLAVQVGSGVAVALPESSALRWILLALTGPIGLLWCLGWALQGASAERALLGALPGRRAAAGARAAVAALVAVLVCLIALQGAAALDGWARQRGSPLALQRLPDCERIGEHYYAVGTLDAVRALALEALGGSRAAAPLCSSLQPVREATDAALERYLDWYFSLGAEWGRIFHVIAGKPEQFLQERLAQTLAEAPGLEAWTQEVQQQAARRQEALAQGQRRVEEVLARHHLRIDVRRCLVKVAVPRLPELDLLGDARGRLAASAVSGVGVGAFVGVVAGKAVAKTSMQAAAKVLAKAAAKQAAGKMGGMGMGALAGAGLGSAVPGLGTAVGAAVGAVAGFASGMAIDWALLRAEEALTREAMRAELRATLAAELDAVAAALDCPSLVP